MEARQGTSETKIRRKSNLLGDEKSFLQGFRVGGAACSQDMSRHVGNACGFCFSKTRRDRLNVSH
jgi:hypothetical protein